jgi:hypothetical protein
MYLNRLTLIGFIGGDAETKTISNGSTFTAFSVATQRSWKNSEGAWESRTEWHRCVSFGKLADFAATLKKGAHVQVEGELRGREYEKVQFLTLIPFHENAAKGGVPTHSRKRKTCNGADGPVNGDRHGLLRMISKQSCWEGQESDPHQV